MGAGGGPCPPALSCANWSGQHSSCRTRSGIHVAAGASAEECAARWTPNQVRGDGGLAAGGGTCPPALCCAKRSGQHPSCRTRSGIHVAAGASAEGCAGRWTPDQVRGDDGLWGDGRALPPEEAWVCEKGLPLPRALRHAGLVPASRVPAREVATGRPPPTAPASPRRSRWGSGPPRIRLPTRSSRGTPGCRRGPSPSRRG